MTFSLPARADYGRGVFVRSLAICTPSPGRISLAMEDPVHAFQIDFAHHEGVVTEVRARWERQPLSSCAGATGALDAMVGCRLSDNLFDIARHADATRQCTHLHDMFCIAATHAHQQRPDCRWDVVVPDAIDAPVTASLVRDGNTVLSLTLERDYHTIAAPEAMRGMSVLKGFLAWVRRHVPAERHEQYFLMQKGVFLAQIQRIDAESMIGREARLSGPPDGTCFGSQPERYASATRVGVIRRFAGETRGDVLRFFRPGRS
jgi:hypothetical protein